MQEDWTGLLGVKESVEGEENFQSTIRVACKVCDRRFQDRIRFRYRDNLESCVGCATLDWRQNSRQIETQFETQFETS